MKVDVRCPADDTAIGCKARRHTDRITPATITGFAVAVDAPECATALIC